MYILDSYYTKRQDGQRISGAIDSLKRRIKREFSAMSKDEKLEEIKAYVAAVYELDVEDLSSQSRKAPLPDARTMFIGIANDVILGATDTLTKAIGRDRTSWYSYLENYNYYCDTRSTFRRFAQAGIEKFKGL